MTSEDMALWIAEVSRLLGRPVQMERSTAVDGYIIVQRCRVCRTVIEPFTVVWRELDPVGTIGASRDATARWARRIRIDYLRHRCAEPEVGGLSPMEVEILANDLERDATRLATRARRLLAGLGDEAHTDKLSEWTLAVSRIASTMIHEWERIEGPLSSSYVATFADMARKVMADIELLHGNLLAT